MKHRSNDKLKKSSQWFAAALCTLLAGFTVLTCTRSTVPAEDYAQKLEAAERTAACFSYVKELKQERGIPIDPAADPNETGLIGDEYTLITTTLGDLPAKRTSTNPNFAALVVELFHQLGLAPGDKIAVNCSGSFPALNIAVLCAIDTLSLDPVIISSFGASTHGANQPGLTYPDMEYALYQAGLVRHKSDYLSIGGNLDIGTDMDPRLTAEIRARLEADGYPFLYDENLYRNIENRYAYYNEGTPVKCLVNVGGNDASFGDSMVMVHAAGGILTELSEKDHSTGLVQLALADGIPVVHLLNLKGLAADYGLPFDPVPLPTVGEGAVYYHVTYRKPLAAAVLLAAVLMLLRAAYWLRRKE